MSEQKPIVVDVVNPFFTEVLDRFMKTYNEPNITKYVNFLSETLEIEPEVILNFLNQETPEINQELFEIMVYPVVLDDNGQIEKSKVDFLSELAINNSKAPEGDEEETESPVEEEEEKPIEDENKDQEIIVNTFSKQKKPDQTADFSKKIADLERQLKERDRQDRIRDTLFELRNRAAADVENGILPPQAFNVLMGNFNSPSEFYASFSKATAQNKCTEEEHLARIAYTLSVFEECGGHLDFSQNLEDETESKMYQDERLAHLEKAPENLSAMGFKVRKPNK